MIPIRNETGPEDQPPVGTVRAQPNSAEGSHSAVVELANARPYKLLVTPEEAAAKGRAAAEEMAAKWTWAHAARRIAVRLDVIG